jgi:hypothetical protein
MSSLKIGHLLRAGTPGFVAGCAVSQAESPSFGALVRAPLTDGSSVYGLIHDIHIDDDGLVRQLVTGGDIAPEILKDNRERRIVPIEISVISLGTGQEGTISHLLPPRPPLSLDVLYLCSEEETARFTSAGRYGYFRHILQNKDIPTGDLLAAHLEQADRANSKAGNPAWFDSAVQELITLLRDDYPTLMTVLGALSDVQSI